MARARVGLTWFRRGDGKRADDSRGDRRNRHKPINDNDAVYHVEELHPVQDLMAA